MKSSFILIVHFTENQIITITTVSPLNEFESKILLIFFLFIMVLCAQHALVVICKLPMETEYIHYICPNNLP